MHIVPIIVEEKINKSKLMLAFGYLIGVFLLIGVIVFYSWLNARLEEELEPSSKFIENTELQMKFLERIKSGKISNEEYVEIFKANLESEKANYESEKVNRPGFVGG